MIDVPAALVSNGAAILMLLIVLASSRKMIHSDMPDDRLFRAMICCSMLQSVLEVATFLVDGHPNLYILNVGLNSWLYVNNITFALLWVLYVDYKLFADADRLRRRCPFVAIPAMVVAAGVIINLFTPVFFRVTADSVYQRTGGYLLPFLITYGYLAYGVVLVYFYRNKVHKYLFMPAVVFMIPILIGSILQYCFYGYSLVWLGTAIALTSLYINVQNEISYVDPMTGLFTRQYLTQYLSAQIKTCENGGTMSGIMLDIDRFKSINDTFGHLVGDDAIASVGQLLRTSVPAGTMVARYAGDEFVIILPGAGIQKAVAVFGHIAEQAEALNRTEGKPYEIRFSSGCSEYRRGDTVDTFLRKIDMEVYTNKRKNRKLKRRATDRQADSSKMKEDGEGSI